MFEEFQKDFEDIVRDSPVLSDDEHLESDAIVIVLSGPEVVVHDVVPPLELD